jgi:NADH-quinone oxidoreductase subunit K
MNMERYLLLSAVIFCIGMYGVLSRRNILVMIMSLEIMLNGVNIAFVSFALKFGDITGHIFVLIVMGVAAAEVAVGLAIVVAFYRLKKSVDTADLNIMRE